MGKKTMKMKRTRQKFKDDTLERAKQQSDLQQELALHPSLKAIVDNHVNENESENEKEITSTQPSPRPRMPHSSHPSAASLLLVVPDENFTTSSPSQVQRMQQMKSEDIPDLNLDFSLHTLSSRPRSGRRPNHKRMISVDDGTLFRQAFTVSAT